MKISDLLENEELHTSGNDFYIMMYNNDICLVGAFRSGSSPAGTTRIKFIVSDMTGLKERDSNTLIDEDAVGITELFIEPDNKVYGMVNLEMNRGKKRAGFGAKVIKSLVATSDNGLRLFDIQKKAYGFWKKMGTKFYIDSELQSEIQNISKRSSVPYGFIPKGVNVSESLTKDLGTAALGFSLALSPTVLGLVFNSSELKSPELQEIIHNHDEFIQSVEQDIHHVFDPRDAISQAELLKYADQRQKEVLMLARTVWGEARNQGDDGMRAVANVIKNRANSALNKKRGYRLYGQGIIGVIKKNKAFSAWNDGDPNKEKMLTLQPDGSSLTGGDLAAWKTALTIANEVVSGKPGSDNTNGATHYHTTAVSPFWADEEKQVAQKGNHIFYKDIDA